ncbi:DUF1272 domain-containing protein [Ruegeria sp. HKCCD8929]|uniref:DUF1272 domain-containing protein n=1 Tax=Ruegeria sp. HKCCD8929 TaxID=2683006 RepID=UPI001488FA48|nr:DUF1272 domain-containing protein [Ruegeria sp. HKCCD8929]
MLELRPNCELCDRDLPPDSAEARICSYECTYCADCVEARLHNVCPTCGGGFASRPIRPRKSWRSELKLGLANHPASDRRRHSKFSQDDIADHVARIRDIPPEDR